MISIKQGSELEVKGVNFRGRIIPQVQLHSSVTVSCFQQVACSVQHNQVNYLGYIRDLILRSCSYYMIMKGIAAFIVQKLTLTSSKRRLGSSLRSSLEKNVHKEKMHQRRRRLSMHMRYCEACDETRSHYANCVG